MRKDYIDKFEKKMLKRKLIYIITPTIIILLAIMIYALLNYNLNLDIPFLISSTSQSEINSSINNNEDNNKNPSSTITSNTELKDDGTTIITTDIKAPNEVEIDINKDIEEDNININKDKNKNYDNNEILGNGEGDSIYINDNKIENDIMYEKIFVMYAIDNVNVRMTPSICDNIISLKEVGDRITVVGESEDELWFKIKYGDWYAYVAKEYFSASNPN